MKGKIKTKKVFGGKYGKLVMSGLFILFCLFILDRVQAIDLGWWGFFGAIIIVILLWLEIANFYKISEEKK